MFSTNLHLRQRTFTEYDVKARCDNNEGVDGVPYSVVDIEGYIMGISVGEATLFVDLASATAIRDALNEAIKFLGESRDE